MWMVRNTGGKFIDDFLEQGIMGIGWKDVGSIAHIKSRDDVIEKVREVWPEAKSGWTITSGSQLNKFANIIKEGDTVITYDPSLRVYHIGQVAGAYQFTPELEEGLAHNRLVNWEHKIDRDRLSVPTKNTLGSSLTIFSVSGDAGKEIKNLISGADTSQSAADYAESDTALDEDDIFKDYQEKAKEFIKDKLIALDWSEMQELVAGVLRAMGYKTRVSLQGPDRGKDIVASPDGLGLEQPRIVVEVKHRSNTQIGSQDLRSFLGGRHKDDKGLYVSTGGFSKDARYEADRAQIPVTLMDIDELVELVIDNYENMDMEARTLLPLTKIYWPS